jgi:hypothetical protein
MRGRRLRRSVKRVDAAGSGEEVEAIRWRGGCGEGLNGGVEVEERERRQGVRRR